MVIISFARLSRCTFDRKCSNIHTHFPSFPTLPYISRVSKCSVSFFCTFGHVSKSGGQLAKKKIIRNNGENHSIGSTNFAPYRPFPKVVDNNVEKLTFFSNCALYSIAAICYRMWITEQIKDTKMNSVRCPSKFYANSWFNKYEFIYTFAQLYTKRWTNYFCSKN